MGDGDGPRPRPAAAGPPRLPRRPRRTAEGSRGVTPPRRRRDVAGSAYDARPWLASYPTGVPADVDVPDVPLTALLDRTADTAGDRVALAFLGETLTYAELRASVDAAAAGLARLGVARGDRVALVLPTCPQFVVAFFATLRLGAVVVPCNPLHTAAELEDQLGDARPEVVVCLDRAYDRVAAVRARIGSPAVVVASLVDYLPARRRAALRVPLPRTRRRRAELTAPVPDDADAVRFLDLVRTGDGAPARQVRVSPTDDVAVLLWTGGTTGTPRGAVLTHRNLVANAEQNRLWHVDAQHGDERTLLVLPLFHAFGLTVGLLTTIALGGRTVLLPRFDVKAVAAAVKAHRPTLVPGVPPVFRAILDAVPGGGLDLRGVRTCLSGAMPLPVDLAAAFEERTGARLVEGYGTTEASPSTHCTPLRGPVRAGSVGLPLPGTRCRVVAVDDPTREVPVGEPGELAVAGPQVFTGYWGSDAPALTDDGYLLTGDVVVMDADGWFTVVDRVKELVVSGGFNVYPSEVEAVVRTVPGVADVVAAGVPDRFRGEVVHVWVVPRPGSAVDVDAVLVRCEEQLAPYKAPRQVHVVDDLPRSDLGKPLRRRLVDALDLPADPPAPRRSVPGAATRPEDARPAADRPAADRTAPARTAEPRGALPDDLPPAPVPDAPRSTRRRPPPPGRRPTARLPPGDPAAEPPLRRRRPEGERRRADRPPPPDTSPPPG